MRRPRGVEPRYNRCAGLADQDVEFDLGHVQPTAVLGCVDELETVPERLGLVRREGLVERPGSMRVEIVHHQGDPGGVLVAYGDVAQELCPVDLGLALGHLGHALAGEGFCGHEDVACPAACVLVVVSRRLSGTPGDRHPRLADQLPGRLVHADDGEGRIVGTSIDIENLLHGGGEVGVALRRNHPPDPLPWLECVFLRICRTVSCDTASM